MKKAKISSLITVLFSSLLISCSSQDCMKSFFKEIIKKNGDHLLSSSEWYSFSSKASKDNISFEMHGFFNLTFCPKDSWPVSRQYSYNASWIYRDCEFHNEEGFYRADLYVDRQGYLDEESGCVDIKRTRVIGLSNDYEYEFTELKVFRTIPKIYSKFNLNFLDAAKSIDNYVKTKSPDKKMVTDLENHIIFYDYSTISFNDDYTLSKITNTLLNDKNYGTIESCLLSIKEKKAIEIVIDSFNETIIVETGELLFIPVEWPSEIDYRKDFL